MNSELINYINKLNSLGYRVEVHYVGSKFNYHIKIWKQYLDIIEVSRSNIKPDESVKELTEMVMELDKKYAYYTIKENNLVLYNVIRDLLEEGVSINLSKCLMGGIDICMSLDNKTHTWTIPDEMIDDELESTKHAVFANLLKGLGEKLI